MEIILVNFMVVLVIACGFGIYKGLNIRKLSDWLFGLSGLIVGLLAGYLREDIVSGFKFGMLIGTIVMVTGIIMREQRRLWGGGDGG